MQPHTAARVSLNGPDGVSTTKSPRTITGPSARTSTVVGAEGCSTNESETKCSAPDGRIRRGPHSGWRVLWRRALARYGMDGCSLPGIVGVSSLLTRIFPPRTVLTLPRSRSSDDDAPVASSLKSAGPSITKFPGAMTSVTFFKSASMMESGRGGSNT